MIRFLLPVVSVLAVASVRADPIPVAGSMHYLQSFDALAKTPDNNLVLAADNWADDTILPGWYFYRAGNGTAGGSTQGFAGAGFPYRVTDGSLQTGQANGLLNTGWFYSMGTRSTDPATSDRALGVVPITAQGELSYLAVFENTAGIPVRLTNIAYHAEVWRTNQNSAGGPTIETIAVWWRTAATSAELLAMTTAAATVTDWPATVATNPTSHYVTGWNRMANADFTYTSVQVNTMTYESHPVSAVPASVVEIPPGQFFSIRWGNINDRDADALMGIDDLDLTFVADDNAPVLSVSPAANIVRHDNGAGSADDTVSFDVTIAGSNGGTGWTATGATPAAGAFGAVTLSVSAGLLSASVRISDNTFPAVFRDLTVPLPAPYMIGTVNRGAGSQPVSTDAAAPPDAAWVLDPAALTLRMNNGAVSGAGDKTVTSEVISLAGAAGPVTFSANLHVNDRTNGFDSADNFIAVLIFDGDTGNPMSLITAYDTDISGRMDGTELCPAPAVANTVQDFDYPLAAPIPATVTTVQLIITGLTNSPNETMIVSGIRFAVGAADTDGDGMSDAYEDDNGLDRNSAADRDTDLDGDSQSNLSEFKAGTAANDPLSSFRITAASVNAGTGEATLSWTSQPGWRYRFQYAPAPGAAWTGFGAPVNSSGASTTSTQTIPSPPPGSKAFVRVEVLE